MEPRDPVTELTLVADEAAVAKADEPAGPLNQSASSTGTAYGEPPFNAAMMDAVTRAACSLAMVRYAW